MDQPVSPDGSGLLNLIDDLSRQSDPRLTPQTVERLRRELTQRIKAEQGLRDSEAQMRAILGSAVDGIITINDRGIMELANPAAERIFGYRADEMIGQNVKMLMPNPYHDEHDQYIENYKRTRQPKIIGIGREVVGRRKDGSIFPLDLAVSEVQLGNRRIFTGMVRDISARKAVEEELHKAKEEAERANRAKDHFLAVLSHELRTPLTPVLATMSYVETNPDVPQELKEELTTMRRNVEMEARLIDDLLDLTRISRGKIELHCEVVDAHVSLRSALEICQSDIESKDILVSIALRAKQHHVLADPARLQQIFWNIVKNAVKFTPRGGQITLRSTNEENKLRIQISDSGIGMDSETLPRIFNAFEQGERTVTRTFGGLGLGLAIARALVDAHQGRIWAESGGTNLGATFTVELDAAPPAVQPTASAAAAASGARQLVAKNVKILLVEDHEDTLRVMATLLRRYGYDVRTANTVRRALELAEHEHFDLLISDLGLPDGSGLDVMREVKSSYHMKGIALSGFGMEDDLRRSIEAGFEQHLTKPVNIQTLENLIRRVAS
jgi:PAS domain S-box-containing protein